MLFSGRALGGCCLQGWPAGGEAWDPVQRITTLTPFTAANSLVKQVGACGVAWGAMDSWGRGQPSEGGLHRLKEHARREEVCECVICAAVAHGVLCCVQAFRQLRATTAQREPLALLAGRSRGGGALRLRAVGFRHPASAAP
eukprot:517037-Pelagomonas_calceolata.AAC.1